jgi:hypothetical protein
MEVALSQPQPQREIRMLGETRKPDYVEMKLLNQCETLLQAIHLCIQLSRYKHYAICDKLGIDRGHWTRMMQGAAHFPTNKLAALMQLCGNYAPLQWLAKATGQPGTGRTRCSSGLGTVNGWQPPSPNCNP